MGRRRFAKNAESVRHFRLVSRSQSDALADDPDASPLVLEPFVPPGSQRRAGLSEAELLEIPPSLERLGLETFGLESDRSREAKSSGSRRPQPEGIQEEEEDSDLDALDGDCYFPKDGYNYEQHLKRVTGTKGGGGVGVVLEAPVQVPKEELNKQPATTEEEAEAIRALEHADEYEELEDGELEDILPGGVLQPELVLWGPAGEKDKNLPDLALFKLNRDRLGLFGEDEEEPEEDEEEQEEQGKRSVESGSRQANAQKTKSGTAAIEAAEFDNFLVEEYADDEIGDCGEEDIEGHLTLETCDEIFDEYLQRKEAENQKLSSLYEPIRGKCDEVPRVIDETRAIIERYYTYESDEETESGDESEDESRTWDCETILSTLSNVSNRPGKIGRIKVVKKPVPVLKPVQEAAKGSSADAEAEKEDSEPEVVELPEMITVRPRGETPEERRQRKASVKEVRRLCRKMKKESREMYRSEAAKLPAQHGSADIRPKTRCLKL